MSILNIDFSKDRVTQFTEHDGLYWTSDSQDLARLTDKEQRHLQSQEFMDWIQSHNNPRLTSWIRLCFVELEDEDYYYYY